MSAAAFLDQFVIHVRGGGGRHIGFTVGGAGNKPVNIALLGAGKYIVWFDYCLFGPVCD